MLIYKIILIILTTGIENLPVVFYRQIEHSVCNELKGGEAI